MRTTVKTARLALIAASIAFAPFCTALGADTETVAPGTPAEQAAPAPVISSGPAPVITGAPAPVVTSAPAQPTVKLPYGVEDILKLSRAQVGEDVIMNYVHGSGTIYNLTPREIVYLRDQGVSEKVINAMLEQRKRVEMAAQPQAPQTGTMPSPQQSDMSATAPVAQDGPGVAGYADPNRTYAEAPLTPPASSSSSVYVIPYSGAYPYYSYYPYYGYYGPTIALGFGYGYGWHGGHYYYGHGGHAYGGHAYGGGGHGGGGHGGHH